MPDNQGDAELERQLDTWAASQSGVPLRPEIQRKLQSTLTASLVPVRPLPSQGWLVLAFLGLFAACAAGLIAILDKAGFHLMTGAQIVWMTAILTSGGILFSLTLAWQMVPGSRQGFPLSSPLALSCFGVIGGIALLFPWRTSRAFVSEGWPCAVMELNDRRSGNRCLLAARAPRRSLRIRRTWGNVGRVGSRLRLDAASISVHVPAIASSPGLACGNGGNFHRCGRTDGSRAKPSADLVSVTTSPLS